MPLVPITGRTPCSTAASATRGVHAAFVKSITASAAHAANACSGSVAIGTVVPDERTNVSASAKPSTTPTGVMLSAASTASRIARPILPLPETMTRIPSDMGASSIDEASYTRDGGNAGQAVAVGGSVRRRGSG